MTGLSPHRALSSAPLLHMYIHVLICVHTSVHMCGCTQDNFDDYTSGTVCVCVIGLGPNESANLAD